MPKALIMGASSDIGIALCRLYLEKGFEVRAHYNEGQKPFFDLLEEHDNITSFQLDMCDMDSVNDFLDDNGAVVADIDVLISAVGLLESAPYNDITADHLLSALTANTLSPILFTQAVTRGMRDRGFG
ncbi:MAG: SDR family oxidoreductase, partial [Alphaproteobacteria bacterium]|nr:SDR family oxidoreductase [Alphaproteobacteria bacterium]